jgi:trk system potassium uptake protein TrkA
MSKQAIVIGLGHFGMSVARALSERGAEVLAVDSAEPRVRVAAGFAAEAACFDATDTDALARSSPERRDVCICAIGDESREASIICTALLRQMGAGRVIARANDDLHSRILYLVGAHQVVNPERAFGERFARQIMFESVLGEMPLGESLRIAEIRPPAAYVGKTLADLRLPSRHGVTVVAFRRAGTNDVTMPDPNTEIAGNDVLVVVSDEKGIDRLLEGS